VQVPDAVPGDPQRAYSFSHTTTAVQWFKTIFIIYRLSVKTPRNDQLAVVSA